jgi:hypothetical protein
LLLFTYWKFRCCPTLWDRTFAFSRKMRTLTRPEPSLCKINEITLVNQQSPQTLSGYLGSLPLLITDLFISSANEFVLANLASLAVPSQGLYLTLTYVNHSGLSINECSLRRKAYNETKANMILMLHLIIPLKQLLQTFIIVRRIYNWNLSILRQYQLLSTLHCTSTVFHFLFFLGLTSFSIDLFPFTAVTPSTVWLKNIGKPSIRGWREQKFDMEIINSKKLTKRKLQKESC